MEFAIGIAILAIVVGISIWLYRDKEHAQADLASWDEHFKALDAEKIASVERAVKAEAAKVETAVKTEVTKAAEAVKAG